MQGGSLGIKPILTINNQKIEIFDEGLIVNNIYYIKSVCYPTTLHDVDIFINHGGPGTILQGANRRIHQIFIPKVAD